MSVDNAIANHPAAGPRAPAPNADRPVAIEVRDLHKAFRIPTHRVDSLKERVVRPFAAREFRELQALDGISFEIFQGEFFGIVGRNGSGKSTLLKLLASIYRPDRGTIRIAGRLAPFIELGVGFNHELSARENVVLNGVMMGLSPGEMRHRLGAILEFAELGEFVDLKLKNYSSGMLVRLAFALMMEVDADVLLIDEVLAVGDASFQQKCADAFHEMKAEGKTIILVTHEMGTVEEYCHRALLVSDGRVQRLGDPAEIGREYLRLNFEQEVVAVREVPSADSEDVRLLGAHAEDAEGVPVTNFEHGRDIVLAIELEAKRDLAGLDVGFIVANVDGVGVFQFGIPVGEKEGSRAVLAGQRVSIHARIGNNLAAGRYVVHCGVNRAFEGGIALHVNRAVDFLVFGGPRTSGIVVPALGIEARIEDRPDQ